MDDTLYHWSFSSKKQRGPTWYMIAISIMVGLVIWGFLSRQYGLSFILLLVSGVSFFIHNNSQDQVDIELTQSGIKVENTFYEYAKIRSYSFLYFGQEPLFLRLFVSKPGTFRSVDIDVNAQIVNDLKQILPNFLEEDLKQELSFTDRMIHIFRL